MLHTRNFRDMRPPFGDCFAALALLFCHFAQEVPGKNAARYLLSSHADLRISTLTTFQTYQTCRFRQDSPDASSLPRPP